MSADKVGKAEMIIFTGNSHPELAELIASRVKNLGSCTVYKKSNKETAVDIKESVRGKDVFIIQTGTKQPNDNIMEILIMAYACKTSCARSLIGVVPYLPYSRQSKQKKRGAIVMKLFAKLLSKAGFCHLITIDLHQKEIQGFFDFPVDNLRAFPFLADYIEMKIPDYRNAVLVARHPSQAKRATAFASKLHLNLAVIHGSEDRDENDPSDGRNSPPPENSPNDSGASPSQFSSEAKEFRPKFRMDIVGDVSGRIAIIIEDIVDDVNTFIQAASVLKEHGAYKVYVIATHGLLGADTPGLLESSPIDELVITNTIPHEVQKMQCHKIKTVDISQLLSEAIRRIHNQESMSYLFRDMTQD